MKKRSKIILWSASAILLLYFLFISVVYLWVVNKWEKQISTDQYEIVISNIKSSQNLPQKFYEKYKLVNGYDENNTTFDIIASLPWSFASNSCACSDVSYGIVWDTYDRWSLGMKLDNDVSPKKCLDFYMCNFDFLNGAIGIQNASNLYFKKDLSNLSEDEFLKLAIMTKNPAVYNPLSHPEKLEQKLKEYKQ